MLANSEQGIGQVLIVFFVLESVSAEDLLCTNFSRTGLFWTVMDLSSTEEVVRRQNLSSTVSISRFVGTEKFAQNRDFHPRRYSSQ